MSEVTIKFTDADNGVSVHCDWGTDGYQPESHAHAAAMQCIRVLDAECESKSEPVITQAAKVEADLVDAMAAEQKVWLATPQDETAAVTVDVKD